MAYFPAWMSEAFQAGGGKISVEEFMRLALHHPEHGYYSTNIKTVGRGGDFSTSPTLHSALGEAIAGWISERDVIEIGGGDGSLAASVLGAMGWWRRRGVRYHMVDTSGPLIEQQKKKLGRRVRWHASVEEALAACGGAADIFSNELVDAFPAVALRYDGEAGHWDEVLVGDDGIEVFKPSDYGTGEDARDGQRVEWHRGYRDWLRGWLPGWQRGRMLTIDYGWRQEELERRPLNGSLRAYFAQMRLEGSENFYQRPGKQDLTADVNFTELAESGDGLETLNLQSQREFLVEQMPGIEERAEREPALGFLLDEFGAGGSFLVLEQRRAIR